MFFFGLLHRTGSIEGGGRCVYVGGGGSLVEREECVCVCVYISRYRSEPTVTIRADSVK